MGKIKIAISEDNDLLADSIKEKLNFFSEEVEYRFRAKEGKDLINKLDKDSDVDVILMDIEMPNMDGIQATKEVSERYPDIKIIMLTVFDDEEKIFKSIQAGASGYLLKDEKPVKIIEVVNTIMDGGAPMSPTIAAKSLELLRNPKKFEGSQDKLIEDYALSKREVEVLEEISKGSEYTKIAEELFISPKTVRKHIENIYKKLQVHNKMQAVQKAQKHNLI
jgi:DNA-binding NarL/FixJ family response regulator